MHYILKNKYQWCPWFAWHPVKVTTWYSGDKGVLYKVDMVVWLEKIERKKEHFSGPLGYWTYRLFGNKTS